MPDPSPLRAQKAHKGGKFGRGRRSGAPMANDYIPRGGAEFNGWPLTRQPERSSAVAKRPKPLRGCCRVKGWLGEMGASCRSKG
jgi:hypothetical protein